MDNRNDVEIKLDLRQDIDAMVKFRLHRYNVKHCKYMEEHSSYTHNDKTYANFGIFMNDKWVIFEHRAGDGSQVRFGDKMVDASGLSQETLEWLTWYNDLSEDRELAPGTIVYLQPKKSRAARQVDKYVAEGGETLRDIAQRYAVKMKSLMKINGLDGSAELQEGEMVLLRK